MHICGTLLLLRFESHAFFQAEKERTQTACKAEQIHKMTTIFKQNGPKLIDLLLRKERNLTSPLKKIDHLNLAIF